MSCSTLKRARVGLLLCSIAAVMPAWSATDVRWIDAWGAAPDSAGPPLGTQTIRQIIRISIGGSSLRIRLSNLLGTAPVTIGPVHVAAHASGSAIQPGTDHAVTFGGKTAVTIASGADALSDPIAFPVTALEELAVSMYFPIRTGPSTVHGDGIQTAFITSTGDATASTSFPAGEITSSRFFLTDVEVAASAAAQVIVALGDSVTDGDHSTIDRNARWPDALAARLQADLALTSVAVVNSGIAGNRILNDGPVGSSALSRFDRDALSKPGVRWILLLEGINDIGVVETPKDDVSAQQIIDGMKSLIARAHEKGVRILGGTLIPFGGSEWPFHSAAGEAKRQEINAWIRSAGAFDAVVDFEQATRDPSRPDRILPAMDSGDHLHPNDTGYKAMAESIDLRLFTRDK
jgi:lysophospholipase L1-like esterase